MSGKCSGADSVLCGWLKGMRNWLTGDWFGGRKRAGDSTTMSAGLSLDGSAEGRSHDHAADDSIGWRGEGDGKGGNAVGRIEKENRRDQAHRKKVEELEVRQLCWEDWVELRASCSCKVGAAASSHRHAKRSTGHTLTGLASRMASGLQAGLQPSH